MSITIIHHNDLDGRCAAAIAYRELKDRYDTEIDIYSTDYDKDFPKLSNNIEKLYLLDFSFKNDAFQTLVNFVGKDNVVWIDHHISAIKGLPEFKDLNGKRTEEWSGTMLTWMYFHPNTEDIVPYVVQLVDDYDRWIMKYEDDTLDFYEYTQTIDLKNIKGSQWDDLLYKTKCELKPLLKKGSGMRSLRYNELERIIKRIGVPMTIMWEGKPYSCLKINSSYLFSISQIGHIIYDAMNYDIAWLYYEKVNEEGELVRVNNMRSVKVDVSKIAVKHGGGGHPNACGWFEKIGDKIQDQVYEI